MKVDNLQIAYIWLTSKGKQFTTVDGKLVKLIATGDYHMLTNICFKQATLNIDGARVTGEVLVNPPANFGQLANSVLILASSQQAKKLTKFKSKIPLINIELDTADLVEIGSCGLYSLSGLLAKNNTHQNLRSIIINNSIQRITKLSQRLKQHLEDDYEQLLYLAIFRSFGLNRFEGLFSALAAKFPYRHIEQRLKANPTSTGYEYLIADWLGYSGLISYLPKKLLSSGDLKRINKHLALQRSERTEIKISLKHTRPRAHPSLRLIGMLQLLINTKQDGLLLSFLRYFNELNRLDKQSWQDHRRINAEYKKFFIPPDIDGYLGEGYTGSNRIAIITTNSIMPFFLLWVEKTKTQQLKSVLFKFFWTIQGEKGANAKIQSIYSKLNYPKFDSGFKNSIAFSQGLLQIHKNICNDYDKQCKSCVMNRWLS